MPLRIEKRNLGQLEKPHFMIPKNVFDKWSWLSGVLIIRLWVQNLFNVDSLSVGWVNTFLKVSGRQLLYSL